MTDFIKEVKKCKYINKEFIFAGGYLFLLTVYLSRLFLDTTMWYLGWAPHNFLLFIKLCAICILVKIIFYDKWSIKEALFGILFSAVCLIVYLKTGYRETLDLLILVIGAKDVNFRDIVKVYFATGVTLLIITMLASLVGIIPNLIYYKDNHIRNSFGVIYPTDFAAHVFYLVLAYLYLKYDRVKYVDCLAIFGLSFFTYRFCRSETSAICLFLSSLTVVYFIIRKKIVFLKDGDFHFFSIIGIIALPVMMIFSVFATLKYENSAMLTKLNQFISGRLGFSLNAIHQQGISLFGKSFSMIGGGRAEGYQEGYNFIDNSYINILVRYGIVLTAFLLATIIVIIIKNIKSRNTILPCAISLIAIHCFMEHHLIEITYMFFILALFSKSENNKNELLKIPGYLKVRIGIYMLIFPSLIISLSVAVYSAVMIGLDSKFGIVYTFLSIIILILNFLTLQKKNSTKTVFLIFAIWLTIAFYFLFLQGANSIVEIFGANNNFAHKKVFLIILATTIILPLIFSLLNGRIRLLPIVIVLISIFTGISVGAKTIYSKSNTEIETKAIVDYIRDFKGRYSDLNINVFSDMHSYLCSIYEGDRINIGQPDIATENFIYISTVEEKVNMTRRGDIWSENITDTIKIYSNIK